MSFIRTVTGDIAPADLGVTYAHDHLYCVPPLWKQKGETDLLIDDVEATIKDVELFKAAGGQAVYDATAFDYGRDPVALAPSPSAPAFASSPPPASTRPSYGLRRCPAPMSPSETGSPPKAAPSCATMSWRSSPRGWTAPTSGAAWPSSAPATTPSARLTAR